MAMVERLELMAEMIGMPEDGNVQLQRGRSVHWCKDG